MPKPTQFHNISDRTKIDLPQPILMKIFPATQNALCVGLINLVVRYWKRSDQLINT
jgi:dolichyl-phosphate-mannose--protein O-mannosyl transferase